MKIHQIRIDFNVTEQVERYVFVYLIEAQRCYLIDSGVYGSEKQIAEYIKSIGRDVSELKGIFLTHAHPDHIGTAAWFQEHTDCRIYTSQGERRWIENIDLQFQERPIPNFYKLAGKSAVVDVVVKDGDIISLEDNLEIEIISTAGHSSDEVSYRLADSLFVGDTIPVKGDIPIYINKETEIQTLQKIRNLEGIYHYYPAWDRAYSVSDINEKLDAATTLINTLDEQIQKVLQSTLDRDIAVITNMVCKNMKMPYLKENPLFRRTVMAHCLESE